RAPLRGRAAATGGALWPAPRTGRGRDPAAAGDAPGADRPDPQQPGEGHPGRDRRGRPAEESPPGRQGRKERRRQKRRVRSGPGVSGRARRPRGQGRSVRTARKARWTMSRFEEQVAKLRRELGLKGFPGVEGTAQLVEYLGERVEVVEDPEEEYAYCRHWEDGSTSIWVPPNNLLLLSPELGPPLSTVGQYARVEFSCS